MAKKTAPTLNFRDIVLGAEADVIRQALAAREQIDTLIEERRRAYERIAELETQVEDALGETGVFPFPAPPLPVAGFDPKADTVTRPAVKKPAAPKSSSTDDDETAGEAADSDDTDDDSKES
ncbi:MAG: hypothetical protein ABII82_04985 [Verrucomicrobiota bacterium]